MGVTMTIELLSHFLPDTKNLKLHSWQFDDSQATITLIVASTPHVVNCPVCNSLTHKIHSHYERRLTDLPWANYKIILRLHVRKFFCINKACPRQIFTERLSTVTAPWARRTERLTSRLTAIALALGGAAGERLSKDLGYKASRNTLLGLIRKLPLPSSPDPQTLGVDDFAFCKRQKYGTILVDLDKSCPVALLPDRNADTLAQWLNQHPNIQVLSRDRSRTYKSAMDIGAPQAIQVADRFHILQNLKEVLEKVFQAHKDNLKTVDTNYRFESVNNSSSEEIVPVPPPVSETKVEQRKQQHRTKRLAIYNQIWKLHKKCWPTSKIAQKVGVSTRTVQRYLHMPNFPERQTRSDRGKSCLLNPYKEYVLQLWNSGEHKPKRIFRKLEKKGYHGSYMTVNRYIHRLCQAQGWELSKPPKTLKLPQVADPQKPPLTPRRAAWLVLIPLEKRDSDSEKLVEQLMVQHPDLYAAINLAQDFTQIVRQRHHEIFDIWLQQALHSNLAPFQNFVIGIKEDYDAVKAAVTLPVSNSPVEGHINRLKMLKRQMYGRAKIDLLERRCLLTN